MAELGLKLAQVFNVYGTYTPAKASCYFKTFNCQSDIDYFDVSSLDESSSIRGATIDALNFISLTQAEQQLMAFDDVDGIKEAIYQAYSHRDLGRTLMEDPQFLEKIGRFNRRTHTERLAGILDCMVDS